MIYVKQYWRNKAHSAHLVLVSFPFFWGKHSLMQLEIAKCKKIIPNLCNKLIHSPLNQYFSTYSWYNTGGYEINLVGPNPKERKEKVKYWVYHRKRTSSIKLWFQLHVWLIYALYSRSQSKMPFLVGVAVFLKKWKTLLYLLFLFSLTSFSIFEFTKYVYNDSLEYMPVLKNLLMYFSSTEHMFYIQIK
jgi:hypothetical protein